MHDDVAQRLRRPIAARFADSRLDAAALGAVAAVVALIAAQRRPLWADEAATISATTRPLPDLWRMLHHLDAVHAAYYFFMHFWVAVFGTSATALRFPSAVAIGMAGAGVVLLGRRLAGRAVGITAGAVFALIPRVQWAGSEGRQYAAAALLAVILVWVALNAWERGRLRDWAMFAGVAIAGMMTFLFFGFLVATVAVAAIALRRRPLPTIVGAAFSAAVMLPFAIFASTQAAEVSWVRNPTDPLQALGVDLYFSGAESTMGWVVPWMRLLAVVFLVFIVAAMVAAARRAELRGPVLLMLILIVFPLVVLLAVALVGPDSYVARYLTFTTPFLAVLDAVGALGLLTRAPRLVAGVAIAVVLSLGLGPGLAAATRQPYVTTAQEVRTLTQHRHGPGVVVFPSPSTRNRKRLYPDAFHGLRDVTLGETPVQAENLWGSNKPITPASVAGVPQVWYFGPIIDDSTVVRLTELGCRNVREWHFGDDNSLRHFDCAKERDWLSVQGY
jgi:mannosyltransferase